MKSETILDAIERCLSETGMSASAFGKMAINDPHLVRDLRGGRRLWPETEQKVRDCISEASKRRAA